MVITITTKSELLLKIFWTLPSIRQTLMVLIQQNIIVLWIETSLKGSSLISQKLSILTQNFH